MANELITIENLGEFKTKFQQNLKTINYESIVGTGNIDVGVDAYTKTESDEKYATKEELPDLSSYVPRDDYTAAGGLKYTSSDISASAGPFTAPTPKIKLTANGITMGVTADYSTFNSPKSTINTMGSYEIVYGNQEAKFSYSSIELKDSSGVTHKLQNKQDTLVSGTTIKTLNGESILGEGDITLSITRATNEQVDALFEEPEGDDSEEPTT